MIRRKSDKSNWLGQLSERVPLCPLVFAELRDDGTLTTL